MSQFLIQEAQKKPDLKNDNCKMYNNFFCAGIKVFREVTIKTTVFWVAMPWVRGFGRTYHPHLQGQIICQHHK
jgi:hypothetical protein